MSTIQDLLNLPDVDFVDTSVTDLLNGMVADFQTAYQQQTGNSIILAPADPMRLFLYSQASRIYTAYQLINYTGLMNLLKNATGSFLDQIGARVGAVRTPATAATCTEQFNLSAAQSSTVPIPSGTRITFGNNVVFATTAYAEIPIGQTSIQLTVQDLNPCSADNNIPPQINTLVDPIPYVASVQSTTTTQGGADIESDSQFQQDIFMKPESFSTCGPSGAYQYFAKKYDPTVLDVSVVSLNPGEIDIFFILGIYDDNGNLIDTEMPGSTMISGMQAYLSPTNMRPQNDNVLCWQPAQITYNINLTYYIDPANAFNAVNIQTAVNSAVAAYQLWQQSKQGRDINPDYLKYLLIQAGAKRSVITSPVFTQIANTQVAQIGTVNVVYGGIDTL